MRRAPSVPPELPGYTYVKPLGSGGFSDVFLYEQRLPRRRVAVKVLLTEQLGESTRAQFVAEANLMAQLSTHPYIVTIYHADVASDLRPYFVMEYCPGPSLAEQYKREPFGVEDALRIGVRLGGAVATAHSAGILHRDIKPANVLTNDFGWPALTDFGISSTLDDELPVQTITGVTGGRPSDTAATSESQAVGMSVPWSPPEMFDDDPKADVRSDVFSLAATIHTLLAGRTPFEIRGRSNGTLDLIGRIEHGAITPIDRPDMPRSLTYVLQKGMATDRADRYATAVDFARALQRVELELGYSPTGIEVPNLRQQAPEKAAATPEEAETRARTVVTIAAQPPMQAPAPTAAAAPDATATVPDGVLADREHTDSTARGSQDEASDAAAVVEGTVLRSSAREETVVRPRGAASARPETAPDIAGTVTGNDAGTETTAQAPARRPRLLARVIGIAAGVALLAGAIAAVAIVGNPDSDITPSARPTTAQGGGASAGGAVPTPTLDGVETSVDGTVVTFTVSNSAPEDTDVYRWARAETPTQPQLSQTNTIVIEGVTPGARVCIDVYLQRSDGKLSEAEPACNQ
ncbi:serine/threonine protein kinase [Cryobacterium melibiosiphilum]|uniref:non-specific serine/threonine protein kinase n=1 Tax=Cryobacterium melibiosiphilum TaxID=995039 RepID=A0A3A5MJD8_9MICO|nr:serine/threonine-protein kinase [Cryobacterium melibiosiphilum]RJT84724.1 serine/threonine protein kinase [Cryobacterium melibiosiphilum]